MYDIQVCLFLFYRSTDIDYVNRLFYYNYNNDDLR